MVECAHGCGVEFFRIGKDALFVFEGFVFAGFESCRFDFFALIAPEVDHAEAVLLALQEVVEFVGGGAPAGVGGCYCVKRDAGETVEKDALLGLVEAG